MSAVSPVAQGATQNLTLLLAQAGANRLGGLDYAGDISAQDAFAFAQANDCFVVDVRTVPEWQFVGVPDLAHTKGTLAKICWKMYPDFSANGQFMQQLEAAGATADTPLLFLCRSGGRSLDAAVACTAKGYGYCFNISGGFEGDPDAGGHRGTHDGWKAKHLPWKQQ